MSSSDEFQGNRLPPFPVDDGTLDLMWAALHPGPEADRSSLSDFLQLMAQMGGSDPEAVAEVMDDGSDGGPQVVMLRDQFYTHHDVVSALIDEVRRLRKVEAESWESITGLRQELDEARAERAKAEIEREAARAVAARLRSLFEPTGKTSDDWNDLPFVDKLRYRLDRALAQRDQLWLARTAAEAERDRMRTVVEAAEAWRDVEPVDVRVQAAGRALDCAVDAYRSVATPDAEPAPGGER